MQMRWEESLKLPESRRAGSSTPMGEMRGREGGGLLELFHFWLCGANRENGEGDFKEQWVM